MTLIEKQCPACLRFIRDEQEYCEMCKARIAKKKAVEDCMSKNICLGCSSLEKCDKDYSEVADNGNGKD